MLKKFLIIVVISTLLGGGIFYWANSFYNSPGAYAETKHVLIQKGSGSSAIFKQLAENGVVAHPKMLTLIARIKGLKNLRYGEYIFEPGLSPREVMEKLQKGDVVIRKVTIPEGKTIYEILGILSGAEGLTGEIPKDIPEGSIMPQTYLYEWGDSYAKIIGQMQKAMSGTLGKMWEFRRLDIPLASPREALIMASIVEKETGSPDERPLVASVFINRLRLGMQLQSDPTAVYGITAGAPLGHLPNREDIKNNNPYNTYVIPGLPPGPICNPGQAAIEAVLNPPDTNFLYFVASGDGGHNFSSSLAGHNKNINIYRKSRTLSARQKSNMIIKP